MMVFSIVIKAQLPCAGVTAADVFGTPGSFVCVTAPIPPATLSLSALLASPPPLPNALLPSASSSGAAQNVAISGLLDIDVPIYTFAPGSELVFSSASSGINVKSGSTLVLDGVVIHSTTSNATPFRGIRAEPGSTLIVQNCAINDAIRAIEVFQGAFTSITGNGFGGFLFGLGGTNLTAIQLGNPNSITAGQVNFTPGGSISNNVITNVLPFKGSIVPPTTTGISLNNVSNGNIGIAGSYGVNTNTITSVNIGIFMFNSNVEIQNTEIFRPFAAPLDQSFTAISALGSGSVYNLKLSGFGANPNDPALITNYWVGILSENVNVLLEKSKIAIVNRGVQFQRLNAATTVLPVSFVAKNNRFESFSSSGIYSGVATFSEYLVEQNEFRDDLTLISDPDRSCIFWNNSSMVGNLGATIQSNKFYDDSKADPTNNSFYYTHEGVKISGGSKIIVLSNQFVQNYVANTNLQKFHEYYGIRTISGNNCSFHDNSITSVARRQRYRGIQTYNALNNYYLCNDISNMGSGLEFSGPCNTDEHIVSNTLINNTVGLHLQAGTATEVGAQNDKRNEWPNMFGTEALFEGVILPSDPLLALSPFYIEGPDVSISSVWPNPRMPATGWFNPYTGAPNPDYNCFILFPPFPNPNDPPAGLFRSDEEVIKGTYPDFRDYPASGWEARLRAFEHLYYGPLLRPAGSPEDAFYTLHENGNLGKAFRLKDGLEKLWYGNSSLQSAWISNQNNTTAKLAAIRTQEDLLKSTSDITTRQQIIQQLAILNTELSVLRTENQNLATQTGAWITGKLNQLSTDLNAFTANNVWEQNLKTVVSLWITRLSNNAIDWSPAQTITLTNIADQCRFEGGIGVIMARVAIGSYDYNDDLMCPGNGPRESNSIKIVNHMVATPNPCNDVCHIRFENPTDGRIVVLNLNGQEMFLQQLEQSTLVQINTTQWQTGVYVVKILGSAAQLTQSFKLLVNH